MGVVVSAAQASGVGCCCIFCEGRLAGGSLLSLAVSAVSCSACFVPDCTAAGQESRHSARLSHD